MESFARELRGGPGGKSVVHFAGEAHSKLVAIHPFSDGNGRTARLLMNAILIDAGLPPAIIYFQDKERYLDCLSLGNAGDLSPFLMLMTETIDAAMEDIRPKPKEELKKNVSVQEKTWPPISPQVPSERLAQIVRQKAAALPMQRETRYKAWQAGFESFRQEFHAVCAAFNEAYSKDTLFHIKFREFDTLPFEKYETLVRGVPTPRTWFFNVEVSSERHSEQFVFFFQLISEMFLRAGRKVRLTKELPPRDVTLVMSRWSDGTHHRLQNQPIRLREISYVDGQFLFLKSKGPDIYEILSKPTSEVINNFISDVLVTFF